MPKPRLSPAEKRKRTNAQQKSYRERNPEMIDLWRQRYYCKFLQERGWTVTPPPGFPATPEAARKKRDFMENRAIDTPTITPADLANIDELLKGMTKDDLPFE